MLEEIWDRVAYIVMAVAAPAVWYFFMPDFSPLSTRPLGALTFDELVRPIVWLVCWPAIAWWTIGFLYEGITGRDSDELWHPVVDHDAPDRGERHRDVSQHVVADVFEVPVVGELGRIEVRPGAVLFRLGVGAEGRRL